MKISIVTATFNSSATIGATLASIRQQSYGDYEHIVVDGGSSDSTLEIVRDFAIQNQIIKSEKDDGIYDALNKGIKSASGDIIGFLHSDDFFPSDDVLSSIAEAHCDQSVNMTYGDLAYVDREQEARVVRRWRAGKFSYRNLSRGWMPPHPTLYVRRDLLMSNLFDLRYQISGDYDQILRLFSRENANPAYIRRELVHMRVGGASNKNIPNIVKKSYEDLKALEASNIGGTATLFLKNLRKLPQFWVN